MTKPLRVAIIGLGHLHPHEYMPHFQATPATQVVAACDADEKLRDRFAVDYGARAYADWAELLDKE